MYVYSTLRRLEFYYQLQKKKKKKKKKRSNLLDSDKYVGSAFFEITGFSLAYEG
jgi:hypothetical protein